MRRWIVFEVVVAAAAAVFLWQRDGRPNVLIISVDALRADALSCCGGTMAQTPYLDALAARGIVFQQAICDVPWTRASLATMLTGRDAATHRVRSYIDRLRPDLPTLAESFAAAGYHTQAIVSAFELDSIYRLDRGFLGYDDTFTEPVVEVEGEQVHMASVYFGVASKDRSFRRTKLGLDSMRPDEQTTEAAIGFLRREGGRPFLLWVHYFGAHELWRGGATPESLALAYPRVVESTDHEIGRLLRTLEQLGLPQRTIVVVHGVNGQSLSEHDLFGHGTDLYDVSVRVPLVLSWPGHLPAGRRVDDLVSLADVLPTLGDLTGIRVPHSLNGRSLVSTLHEQTDSERALYLETFILASAHLSQVVQRADGSEEHFGGVRRGVRTRRWKFIRSEPHGLIDVDSPAIVDEDLRRSRRREELYDLLADPDEKVDLAASRPQVVQELGAWVDEHVRRGSVEADNE